LQIFPGLDKILPEVTKLTKEKAALQLHITYIIRLSID